MRLAGAMLAGALLASGSPATAAGPAPERVGSWAITPDPPRPGAGCSMALGGARGRLSVMLAGGETRVEASAKAWSTSASLRYPVRLAFDGGLPVDLAAAGAGPDALVLTPDPKLPPTALAERLATGAALAIRGNGDPDVAPASFDISGFGPAYARLRACSEGADARADAARVARRSRCERLAAAAAAATGGKRAAEGFDDRIVVAAPDGEVLVLCGAADEAPSIALSPDGRGATPAVLSTAGTLAMLLADRQAAGIAVLPAACLSRVRRYALRRGGKRISFPEGATALFEGEAAAPPVTVSCRYYDGTKMQPSFTIVAR